MGNLSRKMALERESVGRDHAKRVAAERGAGEEKKWVAKSSEQAKKAEEVWKSQEESARLRGEQIVAVRAALKVSVKEFIQATT